MRVAPSGLSGPEQFLIPLQVANEQGDTAKAESTDDVLPVPLRATTRRVPILEGRTVSGDTVKLRLPGYGVTPTATGHRIGLASARRLGLVSRIRRQLDQYAAYPGRRRHRRVHLPDQQHASKKASIEASPVIDPPLDRRASAGGAGLDAPSRPALCVVDVVAEQPRRGQRPVTVGLVAPPPRCRLARGPARSRSTPRGRRRTGVEVVYRSPTGSSSQTTLTSHAGGYNNPPVVPTRSGPSVTGAPSRPTSCPPGRSLAGRSGASSGAYGPAARSRSSWSPTCTPRPDRDPDRGERGHRRARRPADGRAVPGRGRRPDGHRVAVRPGGRLGPPFVEPDALIKLKPGQKVEAEARRLRHQPLGRAGLVHVEEPHVGPHRHQARCVRHRRRRVHVRAAASYAGPGAVVVEVTAASSTTIPGHLGHLVDPRAGRRDAADPAVSRDPIDVPQAGRCASTSVRCATCGPRTRPRWPTSCGRPTSMRTPPPGWPPVPPDGGVVQVTASADAQGPGHRDPERRRRQQQARPHQHPRRPHAIRLLSRPSGCPRSRPASRRPSTWRAT